MSFFPCHLILKKQMKCTKTPSMQKQRHGWHGCKKGVVGNDKSSQIRSASLEAAQLGCRHVILLEEIKCVKTFLRNTRNVVVCCLTILNLNQSVCLLTFMAQTRLVWKWCMPTNIPVSTSKCSKCFFVHCPVPSSETCNLRLFFWNECSLSKTTTAPSQSKHLFGKKCLMQKYNLP